MTQKRSRFICERCDEGVTETLAGLCRACHKATASERERLFDRLAELELKADPIAQAVLEQRINDTEKRKQEPYRRRAAFKLIKGGKA